MSETIQITAKEFAEMQKVEYAQANGLIAYLVAKGIASKAGEKPNASGKGAKSTIYEIPVQVVLNFSKS